jgi:hypothetical protein
VACAERSSDRSRSRRRRPLPPEYQILLTRNIFSARPAPANATVAASGSTSGDRDLVLRGVASQQGKLLAFVEDQRESRILRLRAGDVVARGRVRRISFGGLDYESSGAVRQVGIGYAFDGTLQVPPVDATQPSDEAESPRGKSGRFKHRAEGQGSEAAPVPAGNGQEKAR